MGRRNPTQNGKRANAAAAKATATDSALAASERRLRETFEQAGLGITRIDMDGRFIEVNQKFCEMLGYSREELVGKRTREVTVPEDYGRGAAFREQTQLGKASGVLIGEKRYIRKDGTHLWVRRTMSPALDEHGRVRDSISVVEDITERKNAEERLQRERVLLRTIIDALPDLIHVKDAHGRLQLGNAAWLGARLLEADQVEGKTVFDVFPDALAKRMDAQDRKIIASGEPVIDQESQVHVFGRDGSTEKRWSLTSKLPMRDDAGNVVGIVGISRDITERRRMERERAMEHGIARVLSERSIEDTMPRLIRTVCEATGWDYGAYWVWDAGSQSLRRAQWWAAFEPELDPADAPYWSEIRMPHRGGLLGKTWVERRASWVSDIAAVEDFRRRPSCVKFGLRSGYAFPILAHGEPIGVMEFFGRELREPDEAMLEVSGAISNQIGQFIQRKRAEESLQESEQQLSAMFENADVGIAVTGLDMRYLRVNDKFCGIMGYEREELMRMRSSDVQVSSNLAAMHENRERMISEGAPGITVEKQLVRKDGSFVWVSLATSLVRASDGAPRYFIAVIQDISESRRAAEALRESEEQFRRLAQYDMLTALPNRGLFHDRLGHAIAQARREQSMLAVLFVDIDRFKHVNDTFGHAAGDQLLKQISERLSACVRGNDTVGRLSGDEFAVVLSGLASPQDAATVARKIVEELDQPFRLEGAELFVTASVGITICPADGADPDVLVRNADVAMYQAKERGRNNYQFYMPEMNRRTREMLSMQAELRHALEREELVLHYQPKVGLVSRQVTGLEALLRWQHPERGLVPPGDFMTLLEESGLIVQAGSWVLRAVCRQLTDWQRAGVPLVPVAVNLSARQFLSGDLASHIRAALLESRVEPTLLEVEITESSIMQDAAEATRTLEYLEALGVKTAIDDFGTGYSSLGYLKRFPLCALKIDRSFVRDITTDPDDATITQAVISMAHSLELKVVAEGVESIEQLAFLMRYGCDEVQGYLFSPPVPADECATFIADPARISAVIDSVGNAAEYVIPARR